MYLFASLDKHFDEGFGAVADSFQDAAMARRVACRIGAWRICSSEAPHEVLSVCTESFFDVKLRSSRPRWASPKATCWPEPCRASNSASSKRGSSCTVTS